MAQRHVISFTMVADFFKDNIKYLQRGENAFKSGHVLSMVFDAEARPAVLKGTVQASMRKTTYSIEISLDMEDNVVSDAKCTCPRGQVKCHHIAALLINAHHNVSVTDQACAWSARRQPAQDDVLTAKQIYPSRHTTYKAVVESISEEAVESFKRKLGPANVVGFTWLLKDEYNTEMDVIVPDIESIIFSAEYLACTDKRQYMIEKCGLTDEKIAKVVENTVGQTHNENWLIARKNRLTASNFGPVLTASRRKRYPPSLFKRLADGYDLSSVLAVQWGKEHEVTAILNEALKNNKTYIIYKDDKGDTAINFAHDYYHQIQGQLHLSKREMCYLIVWTPNECEVVCVFKDESWGENLDILRNFYLEHFVDYVSGKE